MECDWPKWLSNYMISKALGGSKQILDVSIKPAVPYGEHFLSTILRADVNYKNDNSNQQYHTSLILKTFPPGSMEAFVHENGIMQKEVDVYGNLLPLVSEILDRDITPKSFESCNENVLILEDLLLSEYRCCDRDDGMDLKHCLFAVKLLADFHGASYALINVKPCAFSFIKPEAHYAESNESQKQFVYTNFKYVADELKNWPGYEKYSSKLNNIAETIWNRTVSEILPKQDDVLVLNHGDFWANNMLFQYDENNEIRDVKLIDFQFSRWTHPAFDLQNFFTISVRNKEHLPLLIDTYLLRLNEHMHPEKMTKKQLLDALERTEFFGLLVSVCFLPMLLMHPSRTREIVEGLKDFAAFTTTLYAGMLAKNLPSKKCFKRGYFILNVQDY